MSEKLTAEDCLNIRKWLTATSMMIEAKLRTPWAQSELDTWEKINHLSRIPRVTVACPYT